LIGALGNDPTTQVRSAAAQALQATQAQDSNPRGEIGSGWVAPGEQVAVNSRTGRIVTDPQDCSGGRVISVP